MYMNKQQLGPEGQVGENCCFCIFDWGKYSENEKENYLVLEAFHDGSISQEQKYKNIENILRC